MSEAIEVCPYEQCKQPDICPDQECHAPVPAGQKNDPPD